MKKFVVLALLALMLSSPVLAETKPWQFASGWYLAGVTADLVSTDKTLGRCDTCRELNPLMGEHPSDLRLYATGVIVSGAVYMALTKLRKERPKLALTLLIIFGAAHAAAAYHNQGVGR